MEKKFNPNLMSINGMLLYQDHRIITKPLHGWIMLRIQMKARFIFRNSVTNLNNIALMEFLTGFISGSLAIQMSPALC